MPRYKITFETNTSYRKGVSWAVIPEDATIEEIDGPLTAGDIVRLKSYPADRKTIISGPHKTIEMGGDVAKYLTEGQDGHHALIRGGLLERITARDVVGDVVVVDGEPCMKTPSGNLPIKDQV